MSDAEEPAAQFDAYISVLEKRVAVLEAEMDRPEEFTRMKAKVQLGDGPDQRGEVTAETKRESGEEAYTEFTTRMNQAIGHLRHELDIHKDEGGGDE